MCSPAVPFVVVVDVCVYIKDGGEVLHGSANGGWGAGTTGVAVYALPIAVSVDTGFQDGAERGHISIAILLEPWRLKIRQSHPEANEEELLTTFW